MNAITLAVNNGRVTTTSNQIAEHFGKQHKTVLRAIDNLDCSPEFTERNFAPSEYADSTGRMLRAFIITRDGFTFLCMGFTGKEAAQWKERYIAAFNAMEAELQKVSAGSSTKLGRGLRESIQQAIAAELAKALPAMANASRALPPPPTRDYASALELPFVNKVFGEWSHWFFKQTKNMNEAEAIAEFHWQEFCNFARGRQQNRAHEAVDLLKKVLDYMARWSGQHPKEAEFFRHRMLVALVDGLRTNHGASS